MNHKDWFLGFYAARRTARLDGIARKTLTREGEDPNPKWSGTLFKAHQRGLAAIYGSRLTGRLRMGWLGVLLGSSVSKEVVGIHALLPRSLFGYGILRRLLPRVSLAKLTSAPLRF